MLSEEDARILLDQLEQLGSKLGITVRYEQINPDMESASSRGGLCRLGDRNLMLVDSRLGTAARCGVIVEAFKHVDLSCVYMPPLVRRMIEGRKDESG